MDDENTFALLDDLKGSAALSWAADCVEHVAQQVGDTANHDVAASVGMARKYAYDRCFDSAAAHALSTALAKAHRKLSAGRVLGGAITFVGGALARDSLGPVSWEERHIMRGARDQSDYARKDNELKAELVGLLEAAQALCGADPHVAARDASRLCRKALPAEAAWQQQRLHERLEPPSSASREVA